MNMQQRAEMEILRDIRALTDRLTSFKDVDVASMPSVETLTEMAEEAEDLAMEATEKELTRNATAMLVIASKINRLISVMGR